MISLSFRMMSRLVQTYSVTVTPVTVTPLLTVTVLINPMLAKSVTVSKCLLTVTLFPCPEGVTVTEDVCIDKMPITWPVERYVCSQLIFTGRTYLITFHYPVSEQMSLQNGWECLRRRVARGLLCLREGKDGITPEEMSIRGIFYTLINVQLCTSTLNFKLKPPLQVAPDFGANNTDVIRLTIKNEAKIHRQISHCKGFRPHTAFVNGKIFQFNLSSNVII